MKSEKIFACIGDIEPAFVENAERSACKKKYDFRIRKRFIIAAAITSLLVLLGAGFSDYIGGWLNENTKWGVESGYQYTVTEIDGVIIKTHCENNNFIFEFTGAAHATYTDDGENIVIHAQKSENAEFTLVIYASEMYSEEELTKLLSEEFDVNNVVLSKPFEFVVVEDLSQNIPPIAPCP